MHWFKAQLTRLSSVSLFLLYWLVSLLFSLANIFPDTYKVAPITYIYVFFMLMLFLSFYEIGYKYYVVFTVNTRRFITISAHDFENRLRIFEGLALQGEILFLLDKYRVGALNLTYLLTNMLEFNEKLADRSTILTTIGVIPQSFRMSAIGLYLYGSLNGIKYSRSIKVGFVSIIILDILLMIFSANRGAIFFYLGYFLFYFIYLRDFRKPSRKNIMRILLLAILVCTGAISYSLFVAKNRIGVSTSANLGKMQDYNPKYSKYLSGVDYATIGAISSLYKYLTHEYNYIDAILKNAKIVNVAIIPPLGIRIRSQVNKLFPSYVSPSDMELRKIISSSALSSSGWSSMFGLIVLWFGLAGAFFFIVTLGYVCGLVTKQANTFPTIGRWLLAFLVFNSLALSFDWIIRDFDQMVCLIVALRYYSVRIDN